MRLKLLKGDPIEIDGINVYPLTLREIVELGEERYYRYLTILTLSMDNLEELKEQNELSDFELICFLCLIDSSYKDLVLEALSLFCCETFYFSDKLRCFFTEDEKVIDNENFVKIRSVIRKQNCLKDEVTDEQELYANDKAKEIGERFKFFRKRIKPKNKNSIALEDVISGVSARHPSINLFNVWDLTIFQLYNQFERLGLIDNYNNSIFLLPYSEDIGKNLKHWSTTIKEDDF